MLILKENAANSVPNPPAGKDTFFIDDSGTPSVKNAAGTVTTFPTTAASNSQVLFMNGSAITGDADIVWNYNTNVLTVTGNVGATRVLTDNLLYANGVAWDLSDPGGSNTQVQFNDDESFGGSAAFTFNKTTNAVSMTGNLTAGNVSTTDISAVTIGGTLTTTAQPNIVSVGTLTSLAVSGNITGANIYANAGTIGALLLAGTLTTAAQPNITSVGSLTSLTVTGNGSFGNVNGGNLIQANYIGATLTTAAQPNITSVGSLVSLDVTGNANVGNLGTGGLIVATGNVTGGNLVTSGALSVTGNANVGNLGTGGLITATGNVSGGNITTAGQLVSSVATGTAPLVVSSTTVVANLNADLLDGYSTATAATADTVVIRDSNGSFSANIITGTLTGAATTAGTVTTAAQPNITSVGTLTSVSVSGNANVGNLGTGGLIVATGNVTGGNLTTAGALSVTGNANVGNLGTAGLITATGNVSGGNVNATSAVVASTLTSNVATGTAPLTVTSTTRVANLNVAYANVTDRIAMADVNTGIYYPVVVQAQSGNTIPYSNSVFRFTAETGTLQSTLFTGTLTTAAQPNITSVGTLTSLGVNGTVTASTLVSNVATGTAPFTVTSTTQVANLNVATAGTAGTVTTAAQPNITSVGTLTSVSVTGNVAAGNLTTTGVLSVTGTGVSSIAGNLDMTSNTIINLATPTNASDAATKQYVDDVAQGLNIHDACAAATPDTLANITSGTITYNNGTSGVGATLTTTGTFNLIDGVNVQTSGTRILVKNEANAVLNGIYTYTNTTAITRAADFNSVPEVEAGDFTFVTGGTLYDNTGWVQTESPTGIGTAGNNISFTQFSGAGTYNAGTGLTLTGSTFSVNASQTQVTALGTVTSGTWNSLVGSSATFAAGLSGANLASITGANVTGTVSSATSATTAGTVTTAAQPNITSTGTLTSLTVSGNITAQANLTLTSYLVQSVATGISAAGSTQGTATALAKDINVVSTVSAGQGVVLPTAVAGMRITVLNTSATALNVYPATSGVINAAAANAAYSLPANGRLDFIATTTTQWYTMNATYA